MEEEGGFISIEIDSELAYSGTLYYVEMLKQLMDVFHTAGLNHDQPEARAVIGVLWTAFQPFDLDAFMQSCVDMGGGTVLDAGRQLCTSWLNIPDREKFDLDDVPASVRENVDAILTGFNEGMCNLVGRLLPNVHVIDLSNNQEEG